MVFKDLVAFWITDTVSGCSEAAVSAETVQSSLPHVERVLFTTIENNLDNVFDRIEKLPERAYEHWTPDFVRYLGFSLEKLKQKYAIFMGNEFRAWTNTGDIYDMLYRFDMVGFHETHSTNNTQFHVPRCFSGLCLQNDSVLGLRNNVVTVQFVRDWWLMLDKYRDNWDHPDAGLREMLWQYSLYDNNFRYYPLSPLCSAASTEML